MMATNVGIISSIWITFIISCIINQGEVNNMFNVKKELENQEREIAKLTKANVLLEEDNIKLAKRLRKAYNSKKGLTTEQLGIIIVHIKYLIGREL